jgi:hypothetical protein
MNPEITLNNALREQLIDVSPEFYGRMAKITFTLEFYKRERLLISLSILLVSLHPLLTNMVSAIPHLARLLGLYFKATFHTIYYGLRVAKLKTMTGPGKWTNCAMPGRIQAVYERLRTCAVTGLPIAYDVTNDVCHIVP